MSKDLDKKAMSELIGARRTGIGFQTSAWKTKKTLGLRNHLKNIGLLDGVNFDIKEEYLAV
jgi:hypothetical protein